MKLKTIWIALVSLALIAGWSSATSVEKTTTAEKTTTNRGERSKSFNVNKGDNLDVDVDEGDILIHLWDKAQANVEVSGIDDQDAKGLSITQSGSTVRVNYEEEDGHSRHIRFDVSIPAQFNVNVHTSGGDVILQGALTGELRGGTSGGDIRFGDVTGHVDVQTSGGDISGGKVTGDGRLNTSGGDIQLTLITGLGELETSGGDITVGNVGRSLRAHTAGGDVKVGNIGGKADLSTAGGEIIAGDVSGDLIASTAGGDIAVGKVSGSAQLRTAGGDLALTSASGIVTAKTSGGDIDLKNITGSITGSTAGGDISAELIPSGTGKSSLDTAGGEIVLYVPGSAKATIDARIRVRGHWSENRNEYSISSDFKSKSYELSDESHEIHGVYVLNGGGETITLDTVNGDISIRELQH